MRRRGTVIMHMAECKVKCDNDCGLVSATVLLERPNTLTGSQMRETVLTRQIHPIVRAPEYVQWHLFYVLPVHDYGMVKTVERLWIMENKIVFTLRNREDAKFRSVTRHKLWSPACQMYYNLNSKPLLFCPTTYKAPYFLDWHWMLVLDRNCEVWNQTI